MATNGRVHPDCVNASNPYHECGVACLEKIAQGQGRKDKKKSDNRNGIKEITKMIDEGRRGFPTCPKASNPYHECDEHCSNIATKANRRGVKKESGEISKKVDGGRTAYPTCTKASNPYHDCDERCPDKATEANSGGLKKESDNRNGIKGGEITKKMVRGRTTRPTCPKASNPYHECSFLSASLSFGKKKKGSESQPISPQVGNNVSAVKAVYPPDTSSPRSPLPTKKKVDSDTSASSSSSQQHSEEIYSQDDSLDKGIPHSELIPISGIVKQPDGSTILNGSFTCFANGTQTKKKENEKPHALPKASQVVSKKEREAINGALFGSLSFSLSGISHASGESEDDDDTESVISDSYVLIGKYHVRSKVASILKSIFDKHGDVAANCRLQSSVMRAYYLESLCSVIQELQSTSFKQLTKSKIKEMLAVLKDVESAQIDVSWLRSVLNELTEALELNNQHEAAEVAKAKCDQTIESMRNTLESMTQDLAEKEKAVAEAKARVAETRARLSELELESSQLGNTIATIRSKVDSFGNKPLTDGIL